MEISTQKLSDGIVLTLRSPSDSTKSPVIILCHGFCGIREILLPDFAEAFTRAGFSTITFDYRGFGDSDGERGRLVPAMQIDDIISVVNWAREQPSLDAQRIGLWGTSFGGCHVFGAAVRDPGNEESSARHYDIYAGEHFKQVISIQTEWFKTHL